MNYKLDWDEMDEAERNIFRPRWKAPMMVILAVVFTLTSAAGMFATLGLMMS